MPLWHPQYLSPFLFNSRDRKNQKLAWRQGRSNDLMLETKFLSQLPDELVSDWKQLHIGNDGVSQLDHRMTVEQVSADVAASEWLNR